MFGFVTRFFNIFPDDVDLLPPGWATVNEIETYLYDRDSRDSFFTPRSDSEDTMVFLANRRWEAVTAPSTLPSRDAQIAEIAAEYRVERPLAKVLAFVPRHRVIEAAEELRAAA